MINYHFHIDVASKFYVSNRLLKSISCKNCNSNSAGDIHIGLRSVIFDCYNCDTLSEFCVKDACCNNPMIGRVKVVSKSENRLGRIVCRNCGTVHGRFKKSDFVFWDDLDSIPLGSINPFGMLLHNDRHTLKMEAGRRIFSSRARVAKEFWENYYWSEHWRQIRALVLMRDKYLCQSCFSERATQVHHVSYKDLWSEKMEDLMSICKTCHDRFHSDIVFRNSREKYFKAKEQLKHN